MLNHRNTGHLKEVWAKGNRTEPGLIDLWIASNITGVNEDHWGEADADGIVEIGVYGTQIYGYAPLLGTEVYTLFQEIIFECTSTAGYKHAAVYPCTTAARFFADWDRCDLEVACKHLQLCSGIERLIYGWWIGISAWRRDEQTLNNLLDSGALSKVISTFLEAGPRKCMISAEDPWNE